MIWNFRIVVGDFNNSSWTMPLSSYLVSDSFFFNDFSSKSKKRVLESLMILKRGRWLKILGSTQFFLFLLSQWLFSKYCVIFERGKLLNLVHFC